jgi:hypothetical protein
MSTGKTYSTKYLLDSNNNRGAEGQVLSTTSTGIDWVDANTVPGTGLWLANGNDIYNSNSGNVGIGATSSSHKLLVSSSDNNVLKLINEELNYNANQQSILFQGVWWNGNPGALTNTARIAGTHRSNGYHSGGLNFYSYNNGAEVGAMTIIYDGNVGIGTNDPGTKLTVKGAATAGLNQTINIETGGVAAGDGGSLSFSLGSFLGSYPDWRIGQIGAIYESTNSFNGALVFKTSTSQDGGTEKMRITSGGNVGIGEDTPNCKLDVKGAVNTTVIAATTLGDGGGAANRGLAIRTDTDGGEIATVGTGTNMYLNTANNLYLQNASNTKVTMLANGNVGIGTTSPNVPLEVHGADITTRANTTAQSVLRLVRDVTDSNYTSTKDSAVDFMLSRQQTVNNNLPYTRLDIRLAGTTDSSTPSLDVMSLLHNGNVGIGITNPAVPLDVEGKIRSNDSNSADYLEIFCDGSVSGDSYIENSSNNIQIKSAYATSFSTSGSAAMFIDNNQNVGIGLTSPNAKLEVQGTNTAGDLALSNSSTTVSSGDILGKLAFRNYDGSINFSSFSGEVASIRAVAAVDFTGTNGANTDLLFYTNSISPTNGSPVSGGSEKMRILANGNVGIGTTSPGSKLVVAGGTDTAYNDGTLKVVGSIALNAANNLNPALNRWALRPRAAGVEGSFDIYDARHSLSRLTIVNSGNVGIGEASPTAKLEVYHSGGTAFNVTGSQGQLFSVTDDLSGSIFAVSDISGVPIFDVNSSGVSYFDGKVGIGTTSPGGIFEVFQQSTGRTRGDLLVDAGAKYVYVGRLSTTSGDVSSFKVRDRLNRAYFDVNTASKYISFNPEVGDITMQIASGYGFKVNGGQFNVNASSGNVGIGTTTPGTLHGVTYGDTRLHVDGGTSRGQMILEGNVLAGVIMSDNGATANERVFSTMVDGGIYQIKPLNDNGTSTVGGAAITVLHNSYVGIGVASPSTKLEIAGHVTINSPAGASQTSYGLRLRKTNSSSAVQAGGEILASAYPINTNAGNLIFKTADTAANLTQRMIIDGIGNVGIGVTAPTVKLWVNQGNTSGTVIKASGIQAQIEIQTSTAGDAHLYMRPNTTGNNAAIFKMTAGTNYNWRWQDDAATPVVFMQLLQSNSSLSVKGDIIAYGAPSDKRYKENIKPIESALDKAVKLQGVTFDWKESDSILDIKEDIGFIAQDVQKVVPELVRENEDGKLSLRYQGVTPILLEAIKELKAEIDLLKSKPCNCNNCNCSI